MVSVEVSPAVAGGTTITLAVPGGVVDSRRDDSRSEEMEVAGRSLVIIKGHHGFGRGVARRGRWHHDYVGGSWWCGRLQERRLRGKRRRTIADRCDSVQIDSDAGRGQFGNCDRSRRWDANR